MKTATLAPKSVRLTPKHNRTPADASRRLIALNPQVSTSAKEKRMPRMAQSLPRHAS